MNHVKVRYAHTMARKRGVPGLLLVALEADCLMRVLDVKTLKPMYTEVYKENEVIGLSLIV